MREGFDTGHTSDTGQTVQNFSEIDSLTGSPPETGERFRMVISVNTTTRVSAKSPASQTVPVVLEVMSVEAKRGNNGYRAELRVWDQDGIGFDCSITIDETTSQKTVRRTVNTKLVGSLRSAH